MDAQEIELGADGFGQEAGEMLPLAGPRQQADRDEGRAVMFADGPCHPFNPSAGNGLPGPARRFEGDVLEKVISTKQAAGTPLTGFALASG